MEILWIRIHLSTKSIDGLVEELYYYFESLQVLYVLRHPKDVFTSSFHYFGMASFLVNPGTVGQFMEKFLKGESMEHLYKS